MLTGTYAEYVCANPAHLVRIPDGISFEEAAAAPLVSLTALQVRPALGVPEKPRKVTVPIYGPVYTQQSPQLYHLH